MRWVRRLVYRVGFRPKYGSVFFSPTAHVFHETKFVSDAFIRGLSRE